MSINNDRITERPLNALEYWHQDLKISIHLTVLKELVLFKSALCQRGEMGVSSLTLSFSR